MELVKLCGNLSATLRNMGGAETGQELLMMADLTTKINKLVFQFCLLLNYFYFGEFLNFS